MTDVFTPSHLIRTSYTWPLDAHSRLKTLHMEGLSYTKIAQTLNEEFKGRINYLTKNSIDGKIQRLGLANVESRLSLRYMNRKRKPKPEPVCEPTTGGVSLFDVKNLQCRWIETGQDLCCGKRADNAKQPYCQEHAKRVYIGFKSKQADKFREYVK